MAFDITTLTLSTPIPTVASGTLRWVPWSDGSPITLTDPVVSRIRISDDDPYFDAGLYDPTEDDQRLLEDTVIGYGATRVTLPAGTALSNYLGAILETPGGDRFVAMFPRTRVPGDLGQELGDRHMVLIFPQARMVDGMARLPVFDPAVSLTYVEMYGISQDVNQIPYATPCFVQGTLIRTARGPRPVESLRPGDLLVTLDHGLRPVLWRGHRRADRAHLDLRPQDRPIRIAAHALGPGSPARDLLVSPQHRMLLRSVIAERMLGAEEALVAARHLTALPGIDVQTDDRPVTYWHLLMQQHEVIEAEGAWTESLYPGPVALHAFSPAQVTQIHALLPDLARDGPPPLARIVPGGRQARQLALRHLRNAKPLVAARRMSCA